MNKINRTKYYLTPCTWPSDLLHIVCSGNSKDRRKALRTAKRVNPSYRIEFETLGTNRSYFDVLEQREFEDEDL